MAGAEGTLDEKGSAEREASIRNRGLKSTKKKAMINTFTSLFSFILPCSSVLTSTAPERRNPSSLGRTLLSAAGRALADKSCDCDP